MYVYNVYVYVVVAIGSMIATLITRVTKSYRLLLDNRTQALITKKVIAVPLFDIFNLLSFWSDEILILLLALRLKHK